MDRSDTPEPVVAPPVLGSLYYVDRKSGEVKQHYPIDAEKITFGRDPDCDIRLHWDDVSRVHAEIQFDLLQGSATLVVIGTAGLYYIPDNQPRIKLASSSRQPLSTGDGFIIRKKLFRFEYPTEDSNPASTLPPSVLNTPIRGRGTPIKSTPALTPRRRASHRLSLMPSDKPFVPLSPMKRRQSSAGQNGSTPKRSHLSKAEEDDEEVMEGIVDVQQNEDGDLIILETREETPDVIEKPVVAPPKTPRSIPLPASNQTPYVQTPPRVSSRVVMSTPPGPMTLHKALLLRSARKAWVESRPNDVDDAVADGKIDVARRKSKSPSKEEGGVPKRKSLTPRPSVAKPDSDISSEDEDAEGEEEEEVAIAAGKVDLKWVEVDPTVDASFVESDSIEEDLEADMSLDIVGQSIFRQHEDVVLKVQDSYEDQDEEEEEKQEHMEEEGDLEVEFAVHDRFDSQEEDEEPEEEMEMDEQEDEEDDLFAQSNGNSTPVNSRTLDRFYTPQVSRQQNQPRRSLATIGGPATRLLGVPASPNPLGGGAFRPTPSKASAYHMPASFEEDEEEEDEGDKGRGMREVIQTSVSDRELAEIKKRRQSLATPRQLPVAPMSFRDPVKSSFSLVKTPSHPALTRSPTKDTEDEHDDTPIGDIRTRLNKMKRDSSARKLSRPSDRSGRRATVGFVLPETPARPTVKASASYTAAPAVRFGDVAPPTPDTPIVRAFEEEGDSVISSLAQTPLRSAIKKVGTPFSLIRRTPIQETEENDDLPDSPSSPTVIKSALKAATPKKTTTPEIRVEPKTPYMGDIRNLYPTIPSPPSPILSGIKNMYPDLPLPPKTPDMRGMKGMFAAPIGNGGTPGMEGLEEMFASPAGKSPARVQKVEEREVQEEAAQVQPVRRSPRKIRETSAAPMETELRVEEEMQEEVENQASAPALSRQTPKKITTDKISGTPIEVVVIATKSTTSLRAPRSIKPPVSIPVETKSAPSRTRTAAPDTIKASEEDKPSISARRRAIPTAAVEKEIPAIAASKSTRSRTTSIRIPTKACTASIPTSPETKSAPALRGRPKRILSETAEQPATDLAPKPTATTSKPTRSRAAPAPAPAVVERKTVSAPTRRTRAVKEDEGEKENLAEEAKSVPSRIPKARVAKKEVVVGDGAVPTTRATRSRK